MLYRNMVVPCATGVDRQSTPCSPHRRAYSGSARSCSPARLPQ